MLNPVEQSLDGGAEFRTGTLPRQRALVCAVSHIGLPRPDTLRERTQTVV